MDNKRILAWVNYHRTFSQLSHKRLAMASGKSYTVYSSKLNEPERFTLLELFKIFDELKVDRDARLDFFEEVIKAWEKR